MEKKYQQQLHSEKEHFASKINDYDEKLKRIEKELKQAQDKCVLESHGKLGNQLLNEKKIQELQENEKKLSNEIDALKMEKELRVIDISKEFEKEKDVWK